MSFNLAPVLKQRYLDANGNPLAGGKLYTYQAGTVTPQATYTDATGATPNSNPVILDSNGEASVWLDVSLSYKFVLKDSSDVIQFTTDGVIGTSTNNSVSTASIQDLAVTTAKIADKSVTDAKLANDPSIDANRAVSTDSIKTAAVTAPKLDTTTTVESNMVRNLGLSVSVGSGALTIALKNGSGNNPTATDYPSINFKDSSSGGVSNNRKVTSALSVVVPSGTTIGTVSGAQETLYVYAIDNAGSVELAVGTSLVLDEGVLSSSLAIAGGSLRNTLYSTTARSNVPCRLIGKIISTQATAGTWSTSPSVVSVVPFMAVRDNFIVSYQDTGAPYVAGARVQFNSLLYDNTNGAVTTGSSWKFQPTRAAYYLVSCEVVGLSGSQEFAIVKNGTQFKTLASYNASSANVVRGNGAAIVYLNGTTDSIYIASNSGLSNFTTASYGGTTAGSNYVDILEL